MLEPIILWRWWLTDERTGERKLTSYRMTEADARERHGDDAVKEGSTREERYPAGGACDSGKK